MYEQKRIASVVYVKRERERERERERKRKRERERKRKKESERDETINLISECRNKREYRV